MDPIKIWVNFTSSAIISCSRVLLVYLSSLQAYEYAKKLVTVLSVISKPCLVFFMTGINGLKWELDLGIAVKLECVSSQRMRTVPDARLDDGTQMTDEV
jgi:hypothetical protein